MPVSNPGSENKGMVRQKKTEGLGDTLKKVWDAITEPTGTYSRNPSERKQAREKGNEAAKKAGINSRWDVNG